MLRGNGEIKGFNRVVRSDDACKFLLGIVVRGIGHEGQILQISFGDSGEGDWT